MHRTLLSALMLLAACDEVTLSAPDATPEDLGFGTMKVDGLPALGERPVLIIRLTFPDLPYRSGHADPAVMDEWMYGPAPSARTWFSANSRDAFTIVPGDTIPIEHPDTYECAQGWSGCDDPNNREDASYLVAHELALKMAMAQADFDFDRYDVDGDGVVRQSELMVLFYQSASDDLEVNPFGTTGGVARDFPSGCVTVDHPSPESDPPEERKYCGQFVSVAEGVGVATVVHELSHLLLAQDLYGTNCRGKNQSVMSCTVDPTPDTHEWIHLDPWHKLKLGWLRVEGHVVDHEDTLALDLRSAEDEPQVVALYDEAIGLERFQILERRDPRDLHDADNSGEGVAVWQVYESNDRVAPVVDNGEDEPGVYLLSAPDFWHSGRIPWTDAHGDIELEWHDGTPTGAVLQIDPLEGGARRISVER